MQQATSIKQCQIMQFVSCLSLIYFMILIYKVILIFKVHFLHKVKSAVRTIWPTRMPRYCTVPGRSARHGGRVSTVTCQSL